MFSSIDPVSTSIVSHSLELEWEDTLFTNRWARHCGTSRLQRRLGVDTGNCCRSGGCCGCSCCCGGGGSCRDHKWYGGFDWDAMKNGTLDAPYKPVVKSKKDIANFSARKEDMPRQIE